MRFTDKNMCGAWRCEFFSCMNYVDYSYNCNEGLCHVCGIGHSCQHCDNAEDCEDFSHNVKLQNGD